jgi:hypothetical protein
MVGETAGARMNIPEVSPLRANPLLLGRRRIRFCFRGHLGVWAGTLIFLIRPARRSSYNALSPTTTRKSTHRNPKPIQRKALTPMSLTFVVLYADGRREKIVGGHAFANIFGTHLILGEFVQAAYISGLLRCVSLAVVGQRIQIGIRNDHAVKSKFVHQNRRDHVVQRFSPTQSSKFNLCPDFFAVLLT